MKTKKRRIILIVMAMFALTYGMLGNSNGIDQDDQYLAFSEVMPEPIGGIAAITKNIVYPQMAIINNIQGIVYVMAYIDENGVPEDVKIVRGISSGCDEAAIEAVKKAKFKPGQNKGQNVKVKLTMAIVFKL